MSGLSQLPQNSLLRCREALVKTKNKQMDRIVIITKPTRFEDLITTHLTEGAAEFTLGLNGQSIEPYRLEHKTYKGALVQIQQQIPNDCNVAFVTRKDIPTFLFRESDIVIICGPDGLFANTAKYLSDQPIITVNPDPSVRSILMLHSPDKVGKLILDVQAKKHTLEAVPLLKASVNDGESVVWGINDLFIGRKDHVTAIYKITFGVDNRTERQSSSGIIVSTGVGSTGWIRSVVEMMKCLGSYGPTCKLARLPRPTDKELVFVVREPFPSPTTGTSLTTGRITPEVSLTVYSEMSKGGCIFSDGVIEKAVDWNSGSKVVVSVGDRYVQRVV